MDKEGQNLIDCTLYNQLAQGAVKYDKNIVDLMKDKVILDVKVYEEMIRRDARYSLSYNKLHEEIHDAFEREYESTIRSLRDELHNSTRDYLELERKYRKLKEETEEYRKTNWWKRHFGE